MISLVLAICLASFYGGTCILSGLLQFPKKLIPTWAALSMVISGLVLIGTAILVVTNSVLFYVLATCLITLHLLAIYNGLYMHHKLNLFHHTIRAILSVVIIILFVI
ncbi:hypothetical protein [Cytobacillus sp. IB215665]|uniref:hypothetical protein n=1 Tax=Cytobacillus sp. IB215665 TaxID=3097357 RepID=UPI002A11D72C|nr:hypothetical protein [Cytobacillus sp. IB215665]MDX8366567.1 hypothetical protein [Cytobacillus sp. IB215665]